MRSSMLVVYTTRLEDCREFYTGLGLEFRPEKHGSGPCHFAAVLEDGCVFELYPASAGNTTGKLRMGFDLAGPQSDPPLEPGTHVRHDPDGRVVELRVTLTRVEEHRR
jgi:catechol 2,3-dioxygenase-like lactoylglutathione lyase family enzyme